MAESGEARNWPGLIRGAVRECLETWLLQAQAGPVTVEALEGILARSSVLLLRRLEGQPLEAIVVLLPILDPDYARGLPGSKGGADGPEEVMG